MRAVEDQSAPIPERERSNVGKGLLCAVLAAASICVIPFLTGTQWVQCLLYSDEVMLGRANCGAACDAAVLSGRDRVSIGVGWNMPCSN